MPEWLRNVLRCDTIHTRTYVQRRPHPPLYSINTAAINIGGVQKSVKPKEPSVKYRGSANRDPFLRRPPADGITAP